jgi:hypothetical protein
MMPAIRLLTIASMPLDIFSSQRLLVRGDPANMIGVNFQVREIGAPHERRKVINKDVVDVAAGAAWGWGMS